MTAEENPLGVPAEGWTFVGDGGSLWEDKMSDETFVWAEFKPDANGRFGNNCVYIMSRYAYFAIKRWWKQENG